MLNAEGANWNLSTTTGRQRAVRTVSGDAKCLTGFAAALEPDDNALLEKIDRDLNRGINHENNRAVVLFISLCAPTHGEKCTCATVVTCPRCAQSGRTENRGQAAKKTATVSFGWRLENTKVLDICVMQSVPTISRSGKIINSKSLKSQALLFYVFLAGEEVFRREYLASLFWGEREPSLAQDNLRQALARIKRTCGDLSPALTIDRKTLTVDHDSIRIDLDKFLKSIEHTPSALNDTDPHMDFDNFFSGFEDVSEPFGSWARVFRNEFENKATQALTRILENENVDPKERERAANLLIQIDPTNEEAVRFKMRYFASIGRQAEAVKAYNSLYQVLDSQYSVDPSPDTIELNAAIKLGSVDSSEFRQAPSLPHPRDDSKVPPNIYVAEFSIDESNPVTERMGNLFRTEVLGNLSKFREWNVVDVTPADPSYYRLDCQIDEHLEDIVAIVTLRNLPDQRIVWSERFIAGFDNWRQTQWRIAQQFALAINQSLTVDRIRANSHMQLEERSVFDKWALCHSLNLEWSPATSNTVIATLEDILASAPDFNLAHSYLAEMHNKMHLVYPGIFRSKDSVEKALHHAKIAMSLDQLDCHAHRVFAWAKTLNSDFELGEFHFNQAYRLNPSNLYVSTSCALGFAYLDNLKKACEIADEISKASVPLQPFQWGYVQNIYYLAGRLDDAKTAGELAGNSISNLPAWQALIHVELGETEAAKTCMDQFYEGTSQRWHGEQPVSKSRIAEWLLHCFPMKNEKKRATLLQDMLSI